MRDASKALHLTATIAKGSGSGTYGSVDLGAGARSFNVGDGAAEVDVSVGVPIGNGGLTKTGPGTLRLSSPNSYGLGTIVSAGRLLVNNTSGFGTGSGAVTVNGGILGGTGSIAGSVTLNSAGTLAPGTASAMGTLTFNSAPLLSGTNYLRVDRNGGAPLADKLVVASGTLTYGGTLVVSNAGAPLAGGEVFTNFSAGTYAGGFMTSNLPALTSGLNWYLGNLRTNGTIKVNRWPVVNGIAVTNTPGQMLLIPIATLIASATDADGDALSLAGFNPVTTNGVSLSADATYIYYFNSAYVADQFGYTVSDGRGGTVSGLAQVRPPPATSPAISSGPDSITNVVGENATFTVSATGTGPLGYQWRFNDAAIAAASASAYTRTNVQSSHAGGYSVVVSNVAGMVTSATALLTVIQPPHLELMTVLPGGSFQFQVSGSPGQYAVDATTNLFNWDELTNLTTTNTSFPYADGNTNLPARYYRARLIR